MISSHSPTRRFFFGGLSSFNRLNCSFSLMSIEGLSVSSSAGGARSSSSSSGSTSSVFIASPSGTSSVLAGSGAATCGLTANRADFSIWRRTSMRRRVSSMSSSLSEFSELVSELRLLVSELDSVSEAVGNHRRFRLFLNVTLQTKFCNI